MRAENGCRTPGWRPQRFVDRPQLQFLQQHELLSSLPRAEAQTRILTAKGTDLQWDPTIRWDQQNTVIHILARMQHRLLETELRTRDETTRIARQGIATGVRGVSCHSADELSPVHLEGSYLGSDLPKSWQNVDTKV